MGDCDCGEKKHSSALSTLSAIGETQSPRSCSNCDLLDALNEIKAAVEANKPIDYTSLLESIKTEIDGEGNELEAALDEFAATSQAEDDETQAAIEALKAANTEKSDALQSALESESDETQAAVANLEAKLQQEQDQTQALLSQLEQSEDENAAALIAALTAHQAALEAALANIEDSDDTDDDVRVSTVVTDGLCVFSGGKATGEVGRILTLLKFDELGNLIAEESINQKLVNGAWVALGESEMLAQCQQSQIITIEAPCAAANGVEAQIIQPMPDGVDFSTYEFPWDSSEVVESKFIAGTAVRDSDMVIESGSDVLAIRGVIKVPQTGIWIRAERIGGVTDAIRLRVNGKTVVGEYNADNNTTSSTVPIFISCGEIEFEALAFDAQAAAGVALKWSESADGTYTEVPIDVVQFESTKWTKQQALLTGSGVTDFEGNTIADYRTVVGEEGCGCGY